MIVTLQKDSQGNFIPAGKEQIMGALAAKNDIPQKHNEPISEQDILKSALEEMENSRTVTLEDLGL